MLCFSPDDLYLLTSAVDNEVRQYITVDGRLQTKLDMYQTAGPTIATLLHERRDMIISDLRRERVCVCTARTLARCSTIVKCTQDGSTTRCTSNRCAATHILPTPSVLTPRLCASEEIVKVNMNSHGATGDDISEIVRRTSSPSACANKKCLITGEEAGAGEQDGTSKAASIKWSREMERTPIGL